MGCQSWALVRHYDRTVRAGVRLLLAHFRQIHTPTQKCNTVFVVWNEVKPNETTECELSWTNIWAMREGYQQRPTAAGTAAGDDGVSKGLYNAHCSEKQENPYCGMRNLFNLYSAIVSIMGTRKRNFCPRSRLSPNRSVFFAYSAFR